MVMAVGMEKDAIFEFIAAAMDTPLDVMVVPAGFLGDELAANRADTPLHPPLEAQFGSMPEIVQGFAV